MKTSDWAPFVGRAPATLLGGLCLVALTPQAQMQPGPGRRWYQFLELCRGLGPNLNPQIHPISHTNSHTTHASYMPSFPR
jgi:hypothetical protein